MCFFCFLLQMLIGVKKNVLFFLQNLLKLKKRFIFAADKRHPLYTAKFGDGCAGFGAYINKFAAINSRVCWKRHQFAFFFIFIRYWKIAIFILTFQSNYTQNDLFSAELSITYKYSFFILYLFWTTIWYIYCFSKYLQIDNKLTIYLNNQNQ